MVPGTFGSIQLCISASFPKLELMERPKLTAISRNNLKAMKEGDLAFFYHRYVREETKPSSKHLPNFGVSTYNPLRTLGLTQ
jgi:hypothetical protein